jgi:uncharacterized membrane protein YczE
MAAHPHAAAFGARPAWRAGPATLARLIAGLCLFGVGEGLLVGSALGNSPWTVLAQGVAIQTPLSVGEATIVISFVVLLLWVPLRQWPGLGTVCNAVGIGLALDATLAALPAGMPLALRALLIPASIACVALGSMLYLGAALGPGPRDGLMSGLFRVTRRPVGLIRVAIELTVLAGGWALGGTVGAGTVAFALLIGPAVAFLLGRSQAAAVPTATPPGS